MKTTKKRVALLDISLLVALFSPDHIHHEFAHDWFADHRTAGWATSPITENGFVRVLAQLSQDSALFRARELVERLAAFRASGNHQFWPDAVSLCDEKLFDQSMLQGHRQVTDVYLLGLAVKMGGRLATFDRSIALDAVRGATRDSIQFIQPIT